MFDEIGYWSEVKLDIVREYAKAYSTILSAQRRPSLYHVYIDAFAGAGTHISRSTQDFVLGSPLNALAVKPPFKEYHLIDLDRRKVQSLRQAVAQFQNVHVYEGDCNQLMLQDILPQVRYEDYRRALCLLDPYGLHLDWEVVQTAGRMRTIDVFLNFPVMDMTRNVLWRNPEKVEKRQVQRMDAFWGDNSWRSIAYDTQGNLFGMEMKVDIQTITDAFRLRLREVAGFRHVPDPIPMRNTQGAIVYYLFFATHKHVAEKIVKDIFAKYRNKGDQ